MKTYKVTNSAVWFLVKTRTKADAIREGKRELFGYVTAEEATPEDIVYFKALKGDDSIENVIKSKNGGYTLMVINK